MTVFAWIPLNMCVMSPCTQVSAKQLCWVSCAQCYCIVSESGMSLHPSKTLSHRACTPFNNYLCYADDMAANKACHESAAKVLNAIFAAYDNDVLCKCFLVEQHLQYTFTNGAATDPDKAATVNLHALFNALEGHLPAQLTFAACLTRLCLVEIGNQLHLGKSHELANTAAPLAAKALLSNFFKDVYMAIRAALEVLTQIFWLHDDMHLLSEQVQ